MITEAKTLSTELLDSIAKSAPKVAFIPDKEIEKALSYLEKNSLPNAKNEEYKYCNIEAFVRKEFKSLHQSFLIPTRSEVEKYKLKNAINLIVVNGEWNEELSDKIIIKGLRVKKLSDYSSNNTPVSSISNKHSDYFISLASAYCQNGLYIGIEEGNKIPIPIHIIYVQSSKTASWANIRNLIEVKKDSELVLIERFVNSQNSKTFSNFLSEKLIHEKANLKACTIQQENKVSASLHTNLVEIEKNSTYEHTTITQGGILVRNNHQAYLKGENSRADLFGLNLSTENNLVDNHTLMDHMVPNCESNELYKGIVYGKSTTVFNGKIHVAPHAQKTNAYQSSKNILLSDEASVYTKPQLEIYANDVKCSHGTSTGKLDEQAVFYLKSRGIGHLSAQKLLLLAFANEVIQKIQVEEVKEELENLILPKD